LEQRLGPGPIQALRAPPSLLDEPRLRQHAEGFRDRRSTDVEVRGDLTRRPLLAPHQPQDLLTTRLGDCLQSRFHSGTVIDRLRIRQVTDTRSPTEVAGSTAVA